MAFKILGKITDLQVIARGRGIRTIDRLRKKYGPGNWRKMKGRARVRLSDGKVRRAEIHWYEAHGLGRHDFKIKRYLD